MWQCMALRQYGFLNLKCCQSRIAKRITLYYVSGSFEEQCIALHPLVQSLGVEQSEKAALLTKQEHVCIAL
jgi:hypothetical protein